MKNLISILFITPLLSYSQENCVSTFQNNIEFTVCSNHSDFEKDYIGVFTYNDSSFFERTRMQFTSQDKDGVYRGTYAFPGDVTFASGPNTSNFFDSEYINTFQDKVWFITQEQIENHVLNYNNSQYVTPNEIADWPAQFEGRDLAPFFDANFNGIYDPENGDAPDIPGDFAVLRILNDIHPSVYENTNLVESQGLEITQLYYGYTDKGAPINNAIYTRTTIQNLSNRTYQEFKTGRHLAFYKGMPWENMQMGTSSGHDAIFGYGHKSNASPTGAVATAVYCYLNQPLHASFIRPGSGASGQAFHNVMSALNDDGSEPSEHYPYYYDDLPSKVGGNSALQDSSDARYPSLSGSVLIQDFKPQQKIAIDAVYFISDHTDKPWPDNLDDLEDDIIKIKGLYKETVGVNEMPQQAGLNISPQPVGSNLHLQGSYPIAGSQYQICSTQGRVLQEGKVKGNDIPLEKHYPSGIYILKIQGQNGKQPQVIRWIKE